MRNFSFFVRLTTLISAALMCFVGAPKASGSVVFQGPEGQRFVPPGNIELAFRTFHTSSSSPDARERLTHRCFQAPRQRDAFVCGGETDCGVLTVVFKGNRPIHIWHSFPPQKFAPRCTNELFAEQTGLILKLFLGNDSEAAMSAILSLVENAERGRMTELPNAAGNWKRTREHLGRAVKLNGGSAKIKFHRAEETAEADFWFWSESLR
jgi:hypothetical protein